MGTRTFVYSIFAGFLLLVAVSSLKILAGSTRANAEKEQSSPPVAAPMYTRYCLTKDTPVRAYPFEESQIRDQMPAGTEVRLRLYPMTNWLPIEYIKDGQVKNGIAPWVAVGECTP